MDILIVGGPLHFTRSLSVFLKGCNPALSILTLPDCAAVGASLTEPRPGLVVVCLPESTARLAQFPARCLDLDGQIPVFVLHCPGVPLPAGGIPGGWVALERGGDLTRLAAAARRLAPSLATSAALSGGLCS